MRNRDHASFRREATFHAAPHALVEPVLETDREATPRREEVAPGVHVLHGVMTPKECKRLIAAAEAIGFTHAGLAIGDDTYRVNLAARNNLRVVFDATVTRTASERCTCGAETTSRGTRTHAAAEATPPVKPCAPGRSHMPQKTSPSIAREVAVGLDGGRAVATRPTP